MSTTIDLDKLAKDMLAIFNREKSRSENSYDRVEKPLSSLAAATAAQSLVLIAAEQRAQREAAERKNFTVDKPQR